MTRKTNPPPTRIPMAFAKDREIAGFFRRLTSDLYLIWEKTGGGSLLQIEDGGTGANTAAGARTNLDVYSTAQVYTKTETDTEDENERRYALMVSS